jgi:hypothetical protein
MAAHLPCRPVTNIAQALAGSRPVLRLHTVAFEACVGWRERSGSALISGSTNFLRRV